ncbi:hypothetical protein D3C76_979370 [compost metagenome]
MRVNSSAFCSSNFLPLRTRSGDRAPSRYSHTGRVNSGWLRSALITSMSGVTPMNARSKVLAEMPACKACWRKPACHWAKVCSGRISALASGVAPGRFTTGAGWAGASGKASAAVGFSAQATSRMRLEAAISWRVFQRGRRLGSMHRSRFAGQVPTIPCLRFRCFHAAKK